MLKKIDQSDIDKLDEQQRQHLMVNAEGEYVFAQADEKTWKKHLEQVKAAEAEKKKASEGNKELQERGLECPIDKRLFVDPMKTPCCGKTYCHDCIENALLENDLVCPGCETENVSLEALKPDEDMKEQIKTYQEEKSNEKQRSASPAASINTPKPEETDAGSRPATRDGSKSPTSESGQGKKRSADEAEDSADGNTLEVPAMKRQKSGEGTPAPDAAATSDGSKPSTPAADSSSADTNNFPANMMPPDFSQMQNMGMNFPMAMPNMMGMPFMGMPNMPNMMMGMPNMNMMNMMAGMNGMNGMGNMNSMNMGNMNGMGSNMAMNNNHQPNQNFGNHRGGYNKHAFRNKRGGGFHNHNNNNAGPQQPPKQPEGLSNVPTGPKAMQSTPQGGAAGTNNNNNNGGFYPPTGPANGGKFANQQRYAGNEEDNAYMRQPVNPQRQWQRNNRRGGKMREADYREL
jgi:protein MPE1